MFAPTPPPLTILEFVAHSTVSDCWQLIIVEVNVVITTLSDWLKTSFSHVLRQLHVLAWSFYPYVFCD